MRHFYSILIPVCILLLLASVPLYAGNTGKITGKVVDKQTGEALFGVNILVVGTTRGATSDVEGQYSIIGIPIGNYTVRASQVGYAQTDVKDVKVNADASTPLNFQLISSAVELKGVEVRADQQLVNTLATSNTQTFGKEAIESIPNVKSVEDVVKLQAGVVKQGNNLFVRGGRANEVQYIIDGMPTNSILGNAGDLSGASGTNAQLNALYSGSQTGVVGGGSGLSVSSSAIQSVSVQTGTFDADQGNAQSGIVNIETKSGGDKYTASAAYRTDRIASTNLNEAYTSFSFGGPEPLTKYLFSQMGAKIPGNLTFFINADVNRSDGAYNYVKNEFYNPIERRVELNGFLGGILDGLGFRYKDNQRNRFTFSSKLRYEIGTTDQMSYGYKASLSSKHDYNPSYKYFADSSTVGATLAIQHNVQWTHFFSGGKSFLKVGVGKLEVKDGNDIAGIAPPDYSPAYQNTDVNGDNFVDLSTGQRWYDARTSVFTSRVDFTGQVHELHLLKAGFEFNYEEINSTEIIRPTVPLSDANQTYYPPFPDFLNRNRGEYPGYGQYRWNISNFPNRGAAYLQDNIEFSGLNIHLGLRYDYLDVGKQVFYDDFIKAWEGLTLLKADWAEREPNDPLTGEPGAFKRIKNGSSFLYYFTHGNFSPRLALGYPVTERINFYFNYGHFLQFPERDQYYRDPFVSGSQDNWIGNPGLKPQRTVMYESGFQDQFNDDMAFKITAFYKDIFDYPTLVVRGDKNFRLFQNLDYSSVRGFEIILQQALSGNFSANITYSYQLAKGRSSNPLASIFQPQFQLPRETRLDFDQNHTVNLLMTYRVSPKEEGQFFGLPFVNNYRISFTWNFGSGYPFSPYNGGKTTNTNVYLQNSETKPYTSTLNLSVEKGFRVGENLNLSATLDITNLLNRTNVVSVYDYTGRPTQYGDIDPDNKSANVITPWYKTDFLLLDPTRFDLPRQILFGVRLNWE